MEPADFAQLKALAHRNQLSLNDIFLASYMRALARHNPTVEKLQLACPTDTRQFLTEDTGLRIGNYTARYNPVVTVDLTESFLQSVKKVHQEMGILKQSHEFYESVAPLFEKENQTIEQLRAGLRTSYRPRSISYTNMMTLDAHQLAFGDNTVQTAFMSGAFRKVPNYQVCFNSFAGQLNLVCTVEGTKQNQQEAKNYLQEVKAELKMSLKESQK